MPKLSFLFAFSSLFSTTALAGQVNISPVQDQELNLGAQISVPVYIALTDKQDLKDIKLSLDTTSLTQSFDPGHDISIRLQERFLTVSPAAVTAQLIINTKSSAPSFTGANFRLIARIGDTETTQDVKLAVRAIYVVDVLNGTDGNEFGFSTPAEVAYFRPHSEGLVVSFRNLSDHSLVIHGEDAIPHQDTNTPLTPALVDASGNRTPSEQGVYTIPAILPTDGADLPGYYTIHNIYKPERHAVFNASKVPGSR